MGAQLSLEIRGMEKSFECSRKPKDVSLQELRDRLAEFAEVRGWDQYHSPRNLLLALVIKINAFVHFDCSLYYYLYVIVSCGHIFYFF